VFHAGCPALPAARSTLVEGWFVLALRLPGLDLGNGVLQVFPSSIYV
jgi:hypothetical protein